MKDDPRNCGISGAVMRKLEGSRIKPWKLFLRKQNNKITNQIIKILSEFYSNSLTLTKTGTKGIVYCGGSTFSS